MSRLGKTAIAQIVAYAYAELRSYGVCIDSAAATTNSIYFSLGRGFGELRVSDHSGGKKKWNIIIGGVDAIRGKRNFATEHTYKAFIAYLKEQLKQGRG